MTAQELSLTSGVQWTMKIDTVIRNASSPVKGERGELRVGRSRVRRRIEVVCSANLCVSEVAPGDDWPKIGI